MTIQEQLEKARTLTQATKSESYKDAFSFAGGYTDKTGKDVPVDKSTVRVWLNFMSTVGLTKNGGGYGFMKLEDLILLSAELPQIVDSLLEGNGA